MTLIDALNALVARDPKMLVSDGAATWEIPKLLDSLRDPSAQSKGIGQRSVVIIDLKGRAAIQPASPEGFVAAGDPLYHEVEPG